MRTIVNYPKGLLPAALVVAGFVLLFRRWLFSGFDGAFGDEEDGYLALALIEHWRHVFTGAVHWTDPLFFYPASGTLGYTDAFFLLGLVHAPLRLLGFDPFTAYMLVMAGLAAVGFFGFRRLAVRHFGLPPAVAAIGAFLFTFANVDAVKLIHAQAYCAMLLPILCDLALSAWQSPHRGMLPAAAAGLLYAALFLTAFQTAWFFAFYVLLLVLLYPAVRGMAATRALVGEAMTRRGPMLLAAAGAFAIGLVPFLILYVPVFLAGHSRDFQEVAQNMPDWRDLANVTPENAVWGKLLQWLGIAGRPDRPVWEVELAFTPVTLAVFLTGLTAFLLRGPRRLAARDGFLFMLGAAVVIVWLLQMDFLGWRPWHAVWAAVPGAKAIRYTFRSQLVGNLFVSLVVARALLWVRLPGMWRTILCSVLLAEQINLVWPPVMSRGVALAWIDAVPPPPPGCRIFYVSPGDDATRRSGPQRQDDAMLFAEVRGMPTINGYSSWFPDGWALDEPARPGYAAAVRVWAERNRIAAGLCGVDLRAGRWTSGLP